MTMLTRLALAGALATAALVPTMTAADAGGNNWKYKHHYPYGYGWNPGSAFLAGTVIGLGFGALASPHYYAPPPVYYAPPPPPPPYVDDYDEAHIAWCSRTYRSYNAEDDTWVDYDGVIHQCIGPY